MTFFANLEASARAGGCHPYYFRFNTEMELTIDFTGARARERGPALYELMVLR